MALGERARLPISFEPQPVRRAGEARGLGGPPQRGGGSP